MALHAQDNRDARQVGRRPNNVRGQHKYQLRKRNIQFRFRRKKMEDYLRRMCVWFLIDRSNRSSLFCGLQIEEIFRNPLIRCACDIILLRLRIF